MEMLRFNVHRFNINYKYFTTKETFSQINYKQVLITLLLLNRVLAIA